MKLPLHEALRKACRRPQSTAPRVARELAIVARDTEFSKIR
jgi:hypothetical protein